MVLRPTQPSILSNLYLLILATKNSESLPENIAEWRP